MDQRDLMLDQIGERRFIRSQSAFNPVDLKNPVILSSLPQGHLVAAAGTFAGFNCSCSRKNPGRFVVIPHGFSFW